MKFSVVITVYNKGKQIKNTLKSVLNQTYQDFEIIIINDGSTDDSEKEILKFEDSRIRYYFQENKGAAGARNAGIKKAKNDFIAFLDADDYWFPFYLEEQKKSIEKFPKEKVFSTAKQKRIGEKAFVEDYSIDKNGKFPKLLNYFKSSFQSSILHSSSIVIHKEVFEKVGVYNLKYRSGQDTDLYVRIGLNYKVVFSNRVCVEYIIYENSLFRSTKSLSEKADFEEYEKYGKENLALKKFLDLNRYSLAIFAKINGDEKGFQRNFQKINLKNLNSKQQFLLKQNKIVLKSLIKVKSGFEKLGIKLTAFK